MKRILIICFAIVIAVQLNAQFTKSNITGTGLTCAMCSSNAINKALQAKPFIQSVRADIENSAFHIIFKENTDVDVDDLRKAVEDAGFAIGSLKMTGNFNEVKIGNDVHVQIGSRHFHFLNVSDQVLNGEQTITIIDKDFDRETVQKYSETTKMKCLVSGKAGSCCPGAVAGTRYIHATI